MSDEQTPPDTHEADGSPNRPNRDAVRHALALISSGRAFIQPARRGLVTVIATAEYKEALSALWPLPAVTVHCGNGGCDQRLGKWALHPSSGVAEIADQPQRDTDRGDAPTPWTERAAAGKGGIEQVTKSNDAKGTVRYTCSQCHSRTTVGYRRRTTLYLDALRDRQSRIYLN